ncbi:MAG TPA: hypothetical protein VFM05_11020 [Candidatus Saccharimonadales bacterium]|nr:hypothetical protein [Candidatus Saccharimonadales bacterium]
MARHKQSFHRFLVVACLSLLVLVGIGTVNHVLAQNVTTGYQSDEPLQIGMIVKLKEGDAAKVVPLPQDEIPDMLGVVVSGNESPVSLSNPDAKQEVFVATYGRYDVLVSTQSGSIREGDFVTISSLKGVGMRAETVQELVIGKALRNFDGGSTAVTKMTLDTSNGKREVFIGRIPVEVSVGHNPLYSKDKEQGVPKFLSKAANFVTDRPVTAFRIWASVTALLVSVLVAGTILIAGVRSGMIATGRNPLAKGAIIKSLIQVTIMSLIVFVIGLFAVYLLLRI